MERVCGEGGVWGGCVERVCGGGVWRGCVGRVCGEGMYGEGMYGEGVWRGKEGVSHIR